MLYTLSRALLLIVVTVFLYSECPGFYYSGLCYFKSDQFVSWFDGMSYCYQNTKGLGTLAYIGLDQDTFRQWLDTLRADSYSLELLVGIRRQPWIWVSSEYAGKLIVCVPLICKREYDR